jgi:hypothetical protein
MTPRKPPVSDIQLFAIERIALAQQAILRAARLETGLFTTCLNEALDSTGNPVILMSAELAGDGGERGGPPAGRRRAAVV